MTREKPDSRIPRDGKIKPWEETRIYSETLALVLPLGTQNALYDRVLEDIDPPPKYYRAVIFNGQRCRIRGTTSGIGESREITTVQIWNNEIRCF